MGREVGRFIGPGARAFGRRFATAVNTLLSTDEKGSRFVGASLAVEIITGDALAALTKMSAESVHCVVTSPPYFGLRDYGDV